MDRYLQTNITSNSPTQLIVASLNEEQGIGFTLKEYKSVMLNSSILVVDGNSLDRTVEIAKDLGAEIAFQRGTGKGDAIAEGISQINSYTKYVVFTDADYTYPAEYIPEMIEILNENPKVGMVCGNRFSKMINPGSLRSSFYFGNKAIALVHKILNGVYLNDPLTGLRVVRADLLRELNIRSKGFDIEVELNYQIQKKGYLIVEVPIAYRNRLGKKKLKPQHAASILTRMLTETL